MQRGSTSELASFEQIDFYEKVQSDLDAFSGPLGKTIIKQVKRMFAAVKVGSYPYALATCDHTDSIHHHEKSVDVLPKAYDRLKDLFEFSQRA